MGTNELTVLFNSLTEIAARQKAVTGPLGPNSVLITTIIASALAPSLLALAGWIKSKSIEKIVNGDRLRMSERLVELETSKAVLEERARWRDASDAKKEVVELQAVAKEEGKAEAAKEVIDNKVKGP